MLIRFTRKCSIIGAMRRARSGSGTWQRRLAVLLAIAAVLLRCVIAPGLMPDLAAASRGELKLVICTSAGLKSVAVTGGDKGSPSRRQNAPDVCPYAGPGHVGALAASDPPIAERLPPAFDIPPRGRAPASTQRLAFAARAPPSLI